VGRDERRSRGRGTRRVSRASRRRARVSAKLVVAGFATGRLRGMAVTSAIHGAAMPWSSTSGAGAAGRGSASRRYANGDTRRDTAVRRRIRGFDCISYQRSEGAFDTGAPGSPAPRLPVGELRRLDSHVVERSCSVCNTSASAPAEGARSQAESASRPGSLCRSVALATSGEDNRLDRVSLPRSTWTKGRSYRIPRS
jgi:hypothetical protein